MKESLLDTLTRQHTNNKHTSPPLPQQQHPPLLQQAPPPAPLAPPQSPEQQQVDHQSVISRQEARQNKSERFVSITSSASGGASGADSDAASGSEETKFPLSDR